MSIEKVLAFVEGEMGNSKTGMAKTACTRVTIWRFAANSDCVTCKGEEANVILEVRGVVLDAWKDSITSFQTIRHLFRHLSALEGGDRFERRKKTSVLLAFTSRTLISKLRRKWTSLVFCLLRIRPYHFMREFWFWFFLCQVHLYLMDDPKVSAIIKVCDRPFNQIYFSTFPLWTWMLYLF